jgi:L-fucose dehydrogenase
MDLRLQDKAVLVTGATKGIGAATARAFAAEGARVAILGRDTAAGTTLAGELPRSVFIQADLTREADCQRAIAETVERLGRLDVLVNNAGVNDSVPLTAAPADFLGSLQRNLLHVFSLTHHARAHLIAAKGSVVNVTSKVAWTGQGGTSGYAAAKGAINALTREWAIALGKDGVRVNCVVPAECESDQYDRWFNSQPDPAAARDRRRDAGGTLPAPPEFPDLPSRVPDYADSRATNLRRLPELVPAGRRVRHLR